MAKRSLGLQLQRMFPQRISFKLAFIISLLVIIVVSAIGFSVLTISGSVLRDSVKKSRQEIAAHSAQEIALFIQIPVQLLNTTARFIGRLPTGAWEQETVLVELVMQNPIFEEVFSVDLEGKEMATSNPGYPVKDVSSQEFFREAMKDQTYVSPIRIGPDHLPHITVSLPVRSLGEITGALVAQVNLRGLWDIADSIRIGSTGRAFVMSDQGLLIAHPDKKLVLKNTELTGHEIYQLSLSQGRGSAEHQKDGKTYLESFAFVQGSPSLIVVLEQEAAEAYQLWYNIRDLIGMLLLISLGVILIVSSYLAKWIVRPVEDLRFWSRKVSTGDFDYSIPPKSPDEIGRLFLSFQRMSHKLKHARELERLAALGEAAVTISHKLKNAIVSLKTFAQLFPDRKDDPAFMLRFQTSFTTTIDHLERMFSNLSQITVLHKPKMENVQIAEIIRNAVRGFEEEAEYTEIELIKEIPEDLPLMRGDRDQLQELFINLIQNAFQGMDENGGTLRVVADYNNLESRLVVSFSDNGCGISKQFLEQIFKPFFSGKNGGMGLGLTICKKIVDDHGGQISVESEEEKGTVFWVKFPVHSSAKIQIQAPDKLPAVKIS